MDRRIKVIMNWWIWRFVIGLVWAYVHVAVVVFADNSGQMDEAGALRVWANDGGDKVTQDEQRAVTDSASVVNSVWNGEKIVLFGAQNEVVSFNLVLEMPQGDAISSVGGRSVSVNADNVTVFFNQLTGPNGAKIISRSVTGSDIFNWPGRNIELFYVRYLEIKGLSQLSYNATYDERHVPERFRRPWTGEGDGVGNWEDRPDHNKLYPDIAVPLELETPFEIAAGQNQSIWGDIYIPKSVPPGMYQGTVTINYSLNAANVEENESHVPPQTIMIPVELTVRHFALPDYPSAPSMLFYSVENIGYRYLGDAYIEQGTDAYRQRQSLIDLHFQLAHRHKISLIDEGTLVEEMDALWRDRLSGGLFTAEKGYDGPGVGVGNNVFSIGTYSSWSWREDWAEDSEGDMWRNSDAWVNWFDQKTFDTPTEYFLYLIDESDNYSQTEQWAKWLDNNPGPGSRLMSMATTSEPGHWASDMPSLDIPTSGIDMGITDLWENATRELVQNPDKRFYYYNGIRPASGSYCIEDDGVALRVNGWIQHKKKIDRWFFWESTYYNDYQSGRGEIDLFNTAQTYGTLDGMDDCCGRGEVGWNYMNGDGVLFYPGTDTHYPGSNYGVFGPFASLRLKHWRRGIQDADYLALAERVDPESTAQIVEEMVPMVLWDHGVENEEDPTYVYADISWPTNPDRWEAARKTLADIIESGSGPVDPKPPIDPDKVLPQADIKVDGVDDVISTDSHKTVTFTVALNPGDYADLAANWWFLAVFPDGTFHYYDLLRSNWVEGMVPMYTGGLFGLDGLPLATLSGLSEGRYVVYFGVLINEATSDIMGDIFYDHVTIDVTR